MRKIRRKLYEYIMSLSYPVRREKRLATYHQKIKNFKRIAGNSR